MSLVSHNHQFIGKQIEAATIGIPIAP